MKRLRLSPILLCLLVPWILSASDKHAIICAVGHYPDPAIPNTYALADADSIVHYLTRHGYRVTLLRDSHATKTNLLDAIRAADTVAHLTVIVLGEAIRAANQTWFAPYDADPKDLGTMAPLIELANGLWATQARTMLLFADVGRSNWASRIPPLIAPLPALHQPASTGDRKLALIESCGPNELAREIVAGLGLCSYLYCNLLKYPQMQRTADLDGSKRIELNKLFEFLRKHMQIASGGLQTPRWQTIGDFRAPYLAVKKMPLKS